MRVELRWPAEAPPDEVPRALVLDTNVVLDLLVFADDAVQPVRALLAAQRLRWIATAEMRAELARVLGYPQIVPRLQFYGLAPEAVLAAFDAGTTLVETAPRVAYVCKDTDDQKFIDLAAHHRAVLLSKDKAVICMRKRLLALDALAATALVLESTPPPCPT